MAYSFIQIWSCRLLRFHEMLLKIYLKKENRKRMEKSKKSNPKWIATFARIYTYLYMLKAENFKCHWTFNGQERERDQVEIRWKANGEKSEKGPENQRKRKSIFKVIC